MSVLVLTWDRADVHGGKEYTISNYLTTWQGAKLSCEANDATLASAATTIEDAYLRERFPDPTAE